MDSYALLVLACAAFVGTHFLMSHTLRARMVARLGNGGFMATYSLVSLATFAWAGWAFWNAPMGDFQWVPTDGVWAAASVLTLLASILLVGSFRGNPALPQPNADALATKTPAGVFRVTRHPMMWGVSLWALAHILVAPRTEVFIFMGAMILLGVAGSAGQDRKKAVLGGNSWNLWVSRTSFWPRLSQLGRIGLTAWLSGIALWLVATWAHNFFGAYDAGIFRWLS